MPRLPRRVTPLSSTLVVQTLLHYFIWRQPDLVVHVYFERLKGLVAHCARILSVVSLCIGTEVGPSIADDRELVIRGVLGRICPLMMRLPPLPLFTLLKDFLLPRLVRFFAWNVQELLRGLCLRLVVIVVTWSGEGGLVCEGNIVAGASRPLSGRERYVAKQSVAVLHFLRILKVAFQCPRSASSFFTGVRPRR